MSVSRSYVTRLFEVDTNFKNVFTLKLNKKILEEKLNKKILKEKLNYWKKIDFIYDSKIQLKSRKYYL